MAMKESSFVREVEDRLDVLFGIGLDSSDRGGKAGPDHGNARTILESITAESAGENLEATAVLNMDDPLNGREDSVPPGQEKRYHVLLEEAGEEADPEPGAVDHPVLEEISAVTEPPEPDADGGRRFERIFGDIGSYTPALFSPLKNLKGILLSLEWEISDPLLNRLDVELNGLQELYRHERTILGFLRILRFLERYIRVKRGDSHTESVKLLFSVYDDLERVILSKTMVEEIKRSILVVDIGKYRDWVENINLSFCTGPVAGDSGAPAIAEEPDDASGVLPSSGMEDALPAMEPSLPAMEPPLVMEPPLPVMEPPPGPAPGVLPSAEAGVERSADGSESAGTDLSAVLKTMAPHEAFAFALEEMKKTIHDEFEALRAEIRIRGAR